MARVEIASLSLGCVQDSHGNVQPNRTATILNLAGGAATVYASSSGSSTTTPISNASGYLAGWLEEGIYSFEISGTTHSNIPVVSGQPLGVFNALAYGADATGVADSATAINAALTAAGVDGGMVYVPVGTYKTTTDLLVPSDVTLYGAGLGSVIQNTTTNADVIQNADQTGGNENIEIHSLKVVGAAGSGSPFQKGIYFKNATNCSVHDCFVTASYLQGIQVDGGVRCRITNNNVTLIYHGNGISIDASSIDSVIEGNTIQGVYDCGVGVHNSSARNIIAGNTITTTTVGHGIDVYGAPETVVSNNTILSAASHGVYVHPGISGLPERSVISGNVIKSITGDGIQIFAEADDQIHDIAITGNVIYQPSENGIYIGNGVQRSTISGNVIFGAGDDGIKLIHSASGIPYRLTITGNTARGCTHYGINASANVAECLFAGNYLGGNGTAAITMPAGNFQSGNTDASDILSSGNLNHTGYVQLTEQSDPGAPSTNFVRLYAKDIGGKTAVVARFPTGAVQQLGIEP